MTNAQSFQEGVAFRVCAIIPTYDNPRTVRSVVERVRAHVPNVIVVDDASAEAGREVVAALGREGLADVVHRARNGGKGAAVKTGLARAAELGFTHALQVDADGQHAIDDAPRLLEAARAQPDALVLGAPEFDATAPRGRRIGRLITIFWVNLETGGRVITDPMCGFRVYPVALALRCGARGERMDFDPEIAVRLVWHGAPVVNVPTRVRYLAEEEGGVSHFQLVRDNVRISVLHARLSVERVFGKMLGLEPHRRRLPARSVSTA